MSHVEDGCVRSGVPIFLFHGKNFGDAARFGARIPLCRILSFFIFFQNSCKIIHSEEYKYTGKQKGGDNDRRGTACTADL